MQVLLNITEEEITAIKDLNTDGHCDTDHLNSLCEKLLEAIETEKDETISLSYYTPYIKNVTLGRQLIFDPQTNFGLVEKGAYIRFPHAESVGCRFGIGKDHTGYLVMTRQAWAALNSPEPVEITH